MSNAVKVGIAATLGLVVLAYLIWHIEDLRWFAPQGTRLAARFTSVAGLDDKAAVRVAGVRVGRVDGIRLAGTEARVGLLLDQPVPLTEGTTARIASLGMLGDKYVELVPGPAGAPPLPPGSVIDGHTPVSFDQALAKLDAIGTSIQQVTGSLAGTSAGGGIDRLLDSLHATSEEIRGLVAENRRHVGSMIENFDSASGTLARELPRLAADIERAVDQIAAMVSENRPDLAASMGNIRDLTERLQVSADNLNRISTKIASGEGTLGKLVNSEDAYNELVGTLQSIQGGVESLSGAFGDAGKFRFDLDMHSFYLEQPEEAQSGLRLDITPPAGNKLYRVGLVSRPEGDRSERTRVFTVTHPDGSTDETTIETVTTDDDFVFTGLFGYRAPYRLRLWGGLIEGSGGGRLDYTPVPDRLDLALEAFDFNRNDDLSPHLRLSTRFLFNRHLYVIGGYDDVLENDSLFLGGGLTWNDDNLRYLLGAAARKF